jgi:diguanylate cyclase (GGDEF)-like protein/PAS domain S-box-containing protein
MIVKRGFTVSAQITAYISIICASGVFNLFLCIYAFLKRHTYSSIAKFFIAYVVTITIYCFSSATGLLATNLEEIKFWTIVQYIGIALFPALGLLFVLKYLGFHMSKTIVTSILTIPCITILMVATNDLHHLHYRVFETDPLLGAPFIYQVEGFWYMIHGTVSFSCMFVAFVLACSRWKETNKVYRPQLITLIIGQIVPIVVIFLYLIDVTPRGVDPLPMALWIPSALYLWCIKSSRLFSIMPIAKDTIFNNINDGVLVLDESKQLIEYNNAIQNMFPQLNKTMLGSNFLSMWKSLTNKRFPYVFEQLPITNELSIGESENKKIYQIRVSPLRYKKNSKGYLIIFTDITELKELQLQLEHQAYYDELTQIYNRRAFFQQCEEYYAIATKDSSPFTVILIDIDHFKKVNDTYGHHVGDEVLIHVVNACKIQLPNDALFARYGGEEFVIALKGYNQSYCLALATDICTYVESQYCVTEEWMLNVTISIGVAEASHETAETLQQLLNKADKALYTAKKAGRNRAGVYEDPNISLS